MMSERIAAMSDKVRNTQPTICLDRARLMTEFYSQPSMENYILRRAQAFQYFLENKKIFIDPDGEQLAGHLGSRWQAVPLHPDVTAWLYDDLETLDTRPSDRLEFLPGEKDELRKIAKIWKGHAFGDFARAQTEDRRGYLHPRYFQPIHHESFA